MLTDTAILFLTVAFVLLFVALVTLPKWFAASAVRTRMWRLRDTVVDDVIAGALPRDQVAVRALVDRMDSMLYERGRMTVLEVYLFAHSAKRLDSLLRGNAEAHTSSSAEGLSASEEQRLSKYRERFRALLCEEVLLGSWFGLAHVSLFIPAAFSSCRRAASTDCSTREALKQSVHEAAQMVVARTRFGQHLTVFADYGHNLALGVDLLAR
jgi:hypothetical protein